ncbi:MAG TPA: lysophospholipid transporter LplT, partial [Burkholderiaceae bacterium]|nr:lysophospholipid transporter LplT [Burkholderiaceae bacterium]
DNALLIAAIAMLREVSAPEWMTPQLKGFFFVSYVLLAPFVGAFADAFPKGRVMYYTNLVKIVGCVAMLAGLHPLLAYAIVGLGAAAYSPAKYGILTELLPHEKLVVANGWIEGLTVSSIILGFVIGGLLVSPQAATVLLNIDIPGIDTHIDTIGEAAISIIVLIYSVAAMINLRIPDTGARYAKQAHTPWRLLVDFGHCVTTLWKDRLGQVSLAVTTLFWGTGATLQFIILRWSEQTLGMRLDQGAIMQAVVAVGIAIGSVLAAMRVSLVRALTVLPVGAATGVLVLSLPLASFLGLPTATPGGELIEGFKVSLGMLVAATLMVLIGGLAGYFVVPMNALLQHRGHVLLSAGHSIAVQNFNENLSILVLTNIYAALIGFGLGIDAVIILFGLFLTATMALIMWRHRYNEREFGYTALIGQERGKTTGH